MIQVAIVDDNAEDRAILCNCLRFSEKFGQPFAIDVFPTAEEFLINYTPRYDIVFLDIELGSTNGIDVARDLRKIDRTVILIFVTNMAQLAVKGYEVDAFDFVVKPIEKLTFSLKIKRALGRLIPRSAHSLIVNVNGDLRTIRTDTLRYIEADGHYVCYHTPEANASPPLREYITLSAAEKKLGDKVFVRCNRGTLVNLRFITSIKKDTCVLDDGTELVVARPSRNQFIKMYVEYLGGTR